VRSRRFVLRRGEDDHRRAIRDRRRLGRRSSGGASTRLKGRDPDAPDPDDRAMGSSEFCFTHRVKCGS